MQPAPRYERDNLIFTWPSRVQVDAYFKAIVGTTLFHNLLWNGPAHPDELHEFWAQRMREYEKGVGSVLSLAVIERNTDAMIGSGSLRPVTDRVWDLGYALAPAWQARGHGTVLVGLLVEIAFEERGAERVCADVFVGNHASRRVLEKAGFLLEGTARSAIAKPDGRRDEWRFGMIRADWLARQPPSGRL